MRAITYDSYQVNKTWINMPQPQAKQGELLVKVSASGVNRLDLNRISQRSGAEIIGVEFAGEVIENHSSNKHFKPGTRVCGIINTGGYADYVVISAKQVLIIPTVMTDIQAAAIPENYLTAYQALYWLGKLQPHQTVLIHAGASGVGLAAIQLAKALSTARIIATASAKKHQACYDAGADLVIDYQKEDFALATLNYVPTGVDVILDFIGAPYLTQNLTCAAVDGRHILISTLGGSQVNNLDLRLIADKRLSIIGTLLSPRSDDYKARLLAEFAEKTKQIFTNGKLQPVIDEVFDFNVASLALTKMARNQNIGKIILKH